MGHGHLAAVARSEAPMPARKDQGDGARPGPCQHAAAIHPVTPPAGGCQPCLDRGGTWARLCLCQSCGWVACSDDSPGQHAKAHYEETDHPVVILLQHPHPAAWCYAHQRTV
jgi:uncharacterized UBP type Zn finger protein